MTEKAVPKSITVYRIRSKTTGKFSLGGGDVNWSAGGKIWKGKGPLSNHFTQLTSFGRLEYRRNHAEVVTYELVETEVDVRSALDYMQDVLDRKKIRDDKDEQKRQKREIARLEAELTKRRAQLGSKDGT